MVAMLLGATYMRVSGAWFNAAISAFFIRLNGLNNNPILTSGSSSAFRCLKVIHRFVGGYAENSSNNWPNCQAQTENHITSTGDRPGVMVERTLSLLRDQPGAMVCIGLSA